MEQERITSHHTSRPRRESRQYMPAMKAFYSKSISNNMIGGEYMRFCQGAVIKCGL